MFYNIPFLDLFTETSTHESFIVSTTCHHCDEKLKIEIKDCIYITNSGFWLVNIWKFDNSMK